MHPSILFVLFSFVHCFDQSVLEQFDSNATLTELVEQLSSHPNPFKAQNRELTVDSFESANASLGDLASVVEAAFAQDLNATNATLPDDFPQAPPLPNSEFVAVESSTEALMDRSAVLVTGAPEAIPYSTPLVKECTNRPFDSLTPTEWDNVASAHFDSPKSFYDSAVLVLCDVLSGIVSSINNLHFSSGNVSIVFLPDLAEYGPGNKLRISFLFLDSNNSVVPAQVFMPSLQDAQFAIFTERIGQLSSVSMGAPPPSGRHSSQLLDPVFVTCLVAALVVMGVVAVLSLCLLLCWSKYRKRYSGNWIVNKRSQPHQYHLDAWSYDNVGFQNGADKTRSLSNSSIHGWMMPPAMMEVIEKSHAAPY